MVSKFYKVICLLTLLFSLDAFATHTRPLNCQAGGTSKPFKLDAAVCDVSFFGAVPAFDCLAAFPQTGIYTLINNTPVPIQFNYFRIQNNDALAPGAVTITGNTCGSSLAPGATCTISVTLATAGPFNRVLQVGIDSRQVELDSPIVGCNVPVPPPLPCALNSTVNFATLAGSGITNTGLTVINGDLGISPNGAGSVTGFPPGVVNGNQYLGDATAATAQADLTNLSFCLSALFCPHGILPNPTGETLMSAGPGAVNVYCSPNNINIPGGVLTLNGDANSVFIFQVPGALNMGTSSSIVLTGGVTAANVFFQVGTSATLNTATAFQGTIVADQSITLLGGATVIGRVLAIAGAVNYNDNTVTLP